MDYKQIYDRICNRAKSENRIKGEGVYYEAHHIIPKCLGGKGHEQQYKTHPNIVLLTAKEHLVAHRLLHNIHPENFSLLRAYRAMTKLRKKKRSYLVTSREIAYIKEEYIKNLNLNGENNPFYGKEHNKKTLETLKNKAIERLSKRENHPMFGKIQTDDSNNKNRNSQRTALKSFIFDLQKKQYIFEGTYNQSYNFIKNQTGTGFYKGTKSNFKIRQYTLIDNRFYYCESEKHQPDLIKQNVGEKWKRNSLVIGINSEMKILHFSSIYETVNYIKNNFTCKVPSFQNMEKHISLPDNKKRGWEGYKFYYE